jgi:adenylate cyclase
MNKEIERKFLVIGDFKKFITSSSKISQGYLSSNPERTVRIRIKGDQGFITIKGASNESGLSRYEWEKEISCKEATELLKLAEPGGIDKIRSIIPANNGLNFEVDEFLAKNKGLVMAEIELPSEETVFDKPDWLGKEVTGNIKYYNSYLSKNPYNNW